MALRGVILPLFDLPYYSYSVSLEGNSYILEFVYNSRAEQYFMSILDSNSVPLLQSIGVVPTYPIIVDYALPNLSGWFWMENKSDLISEPYKLHPDKLSEYYNFVYEYVTED